MITINLSINQADQSQKPPPQQSIRQGIPGPRPCLTGLGGRAIDRLTEPRQTPLKCFSLYYPSSHRRIGPGPQRALIADVLPIVSNELYRSHTRHPIPPRFGIAEKLRKAWSEVKRTKGFGPRGLARQVGSFGAVHLLFQKRKQEGKGNGFCLCRGSVREVVRT